MKHKNIYLPIIVVAAALATMGSSCDNKGLGDAPIGEKLEAPRTVIVMPDQFPNLVIVCDGPTRIYVTTRDAPPVLVPDHPLCRGEKSLDEQGKKTKDPQG